MILNLRNWCEEIVVVLIICIIIECLIPKGNNSKYIKIIIGIYIMYVTLNPILNLFNYEIDFKNLFAEFGNYEEVSSSIDDNIKDVYIIGIENNIKEEIEKLGYEVENVEIFVDINYENIEKIELKGIKLLSNLRNDNYIDFGNEFDNFKVIKEYIIKNYNIEEDCIKFK